MEIGWYALERTEWLCVLVDIVPQDPVRTPLIPPDAVGLHHLLRLEWVTPLLVEHDKLNHASFDLSAH